MEQFSASVNEFLTFRRYQILPDKGKISAAEAKSIALAHAGLTEAQVKGLRAEYDRDDGRPEYDVEFRVGSMEYEYEIHAETGKILSWDKEIDD